MGIEQAPESSPITVPVEERASLNSELVDQQGLIGEGVGPLITAEVVIAPEAATDTTDLCESLRLGFDAAYDTYSAVLGSVNAARAEPKGHQKLEQLTIVDRDVVRTDLEAILANEGVLAELTADIDHFTRNPERASPTPHYDILVVADGLTEADDQVIANDLSVRMNSDHKTCIRPNDSNDKRERVTTNKGYRIVLAPRHYNVPSEAATKQARWMRDANQKTAATELQTATDAEALIHATMLAMAGELAADKDTNMHATYYRRFDQIPHPGVVPSFYINHAGELNFGESFVRYVFSARALVVPKVPSV